MNAPFLVNQAVQTPNGLGIYQHHIYKDGTRVEMVSHPAKVAVDLDKCQCAMGKGGGIWYLCGYLTHEVMPA